MAKRKVEPAAKPIQAVLEEFLADQSKRLKPATLRRYESVIELFEHSMDDYGPSGLDEAETALWKRLFDAKGSEHKEFCEIFGPEKIPANVGEFLGWFMPRKVMCGQDLLRAAGTVTKKLSKWLAEKGYVDDDSAGLMADRGARASKDLPAAEALARMLADYAAKTGGAVSQHVEGHFEVRAVGDSSLALSEMFGDVEATVPVPPPAAKSCKPGWTISGCLGRTRRGWRLVEVWNVYT